MTFNNENEQSLYKLFTYGTLKRGEPSHFRMMDNKNGHCRFIGEAKLTKKHPLVIASKYNIPFLLSEEGVGHHVHGEVYEIDVPMLQMLDAFEGHPHYYTRQLKPVEIFVDGKWKTDFVWIYFLCQFRPKLLELPHFENYSSAGDHKLPYIESDDDSWIEDVYKR